MTPTHSWDTTTRTTTMTPTHSWDTTTRKTKMTPTHSWDTTTRTTTMTPTHSWDTTTRTTTMTTTHSWDTTTTSGAACPLGWIDDGNLGCFLFAPQMAGLSWIEALEYCEEQDGFLAEPKFWAKTEDQLNFLTSLAYVEEM